MSSHSLRKAGTSSSSQIMIMIMIMIMITITIMIMIMIMIMTMSSLRDLRCKPCPSTVVNQGGGRGEGQ